MDVKAYFAMLDKRNTICRLSDRNCEEMPIFFYNDIENREQDKCSDNYYTTQLVEDRVKFEFPGCMKIAQSLRTCVPTAAIRKKKELKELRCKGKNKKSTIHFAQTIMVTTPGHPGIASLSLKQ